VRCAAQHANMDVVETPHPAARCESIARKGFALLQQHVGVVACSSQPTVEWLEPPCRNLGGRTCPSHRISVVVINNLLTTQYTNTLEKPGLPCTPKHYDSPHLLEWPPIAKRLPLKAVQAVAKTFTHAFSQNAGRAHPVVRPGLRQT
jgi:hypothetical protein